MRVVIFFLLSLLCAIQAGAQASGTGGSNQSVIQIHITDKDSEQPLVRVSISLKSISSDGKMAVGLSDSLGNGYINKITDGQDAVLEATSVGYLTKRIIVTRDSRNRINLTLEKEFRAMDTVTITGYPTQVCRTLGCMCPFTIRTYRVDSVIDQKRLNPVSAFSVYPNPAAKPAVIHIKYNEAMDGTVQIRNSGGQLVQHQSIKAAAGQIIRLSLGNMAAGLYVVRSINTLSKETLSQKLIIQ